MAAEQKYDSDLKFGFGESLKIFLPFAKDKIVEQIGCVWFVIAYLVVFQVLVLGLSIIYSLMIAMGIGIVILGLAFFMEGLRLGLMPLGELTGSTLPRKFPLYATLIFSFILGILATKAEPAIFVLKQAGSGISPEDAPLLYSLLNDYTDTLVNCVGIGVGLAVALGVLRFFYNWSLKPFIYVGVVTLVVLTSIIQFMPGLTDEVRPILGLAWDCGAVTTGPVTVPLVLALGIGVCRIVSSGDNSSAGFGVVTLASLFPILAVSLLGISYYYQENYFGKDNYPKKEEVTLADGTITTFQKRAEAKIAEIEAKRNEQNAASSLQVFTQEDVKAYSEGELAEKYEMSFSGGTPVLQDGVIVLNNPTVELHRTGNTELVLKEEYAQSPNWEPNIDFLAVLKKSAKDAFNAIMLLCGFLLIVLLAFLREKPRYFDELIIGMGAAIIGMMLFLLGIEIGLNVLGQQVGSNVPSLFGATTPWGMEGFRGPLVAEGFFGKFAAVLFAFVLGYGATLAEPALNALGATVEKITVGAFKKNLLMQSVATGVGLGIGTGIFKIAYNIDLAYLLLPPYVLLIFITYFSSEDFVNFAWDSAGVTTGPITVPLVMAMGLGIGAATGVSDGFGVLALASVGPIMTVLIVGLIVKRKAAKDEASAEQEALDSQPEAA